MFEKPSKTSHWLAKRQLEKVQISIVGFDMHCLRYRFDIRLIDDPNEYLDKLNLEKIKLKYGLTEEDLGK